MLLDLKNITVGADLEELPEGSKFPPGVLILEPSTHFWIPLDVVSGTPGPVANRVSWNPGTLSDPPLLVIVTSFF